MRQRKAPAGGAAQFVVGHVIGPHLSPIARLQVSELAGQVDTTLAHQRRKQRRVAVGRDIPVVRLGQFKAVDGVHADRRRQKAGLALAAQRKAQRRHRQQRDTLKRQHGSARLANFLLVVDADARGAQHPVRHPARTRQPTASRKARVEDHRALLVDEVDTIGFPVATVGQEAVTRLQKESLEGLEPKIQRGAFKDFAGAVDLHPTARARLVLGLVVLEPVGSDHQVAATQHGLAFGDQVNVGPSRDAFAGDAAR